MSPANGAAPPDFAEVERRFTAHLRAPDHHAAPADVDAARVAVYAGLVFRNLDSLLSGCFPVLRKVLPAATWRALVRAFLVHHRAHTPLFPRVPGEFVQFLENGAGGCACPDWSVELAHYEWLELEVGQDPRELDAANCEADADLLADIPVVNPLARLRLYRWPVHRLGPDFLPEQPPEAGTCLVVFRGRDDGVAFAQLTPVTARLVEMMQQNPAQASGETLLRALAGELGSPDPEALVGHGRAILADLHRRELLLGARRAR